VNFADAPRRRAVRRRSHQARRRRAEIFFRWLHTRGRIPRDITETLPLPRTERYLPETMNELQVDRLLDGISDAAPHALRDRAMLELLYASGLRVSELVNARLEFLDFDNRIIRVIGKGNKTRLVPVGKRACDAIKTYLDRERPGLVKKKTGNEIFLSARGARLSTSASGKIVKRTAKHAGLDLNVYPHLLRHSFATHLLSNGRRPPHHPGNARATPTSRRPRLHPRRSAAVEGRPPPVPPKGKITPHLFLVIVLLILLLSFKDEEEDYEDEHGIHSRAK